MDRRDYLFRAIGFVFSIVLASVQKTYNQNVGPLVRSTHGEVWPKPMVQHNYDKYLKLEPEHFHFNIIAGYHCDELQDAFSRYNNMLFLKARKYTKHMKNVSKNVIAGTLHRLNVRMTNPCEDYPSLNMDEKYEIEINISSGTLLASSIWGILRGLETFSQLVTLESDGSTFIVRCTSIKDYPKFKHRGYLLDTSRHYFPIQTILKTLDAMSYSKLNVFHWHMVDDNSFPFQSSVFPNLSEKGAYGNSAVYTRNYVKIVIEYAKLRGIRVIPEFDSPGHTLSWGLGGIPGLLTQCLESLPDDFGPIDPTIENNYNFIGTLLNEVNEIFQDHYLHLGGDEIKTFCWETNKNIQKFMIHNNMTDTRDLTDYYFQNILKITQELKAIPIVWEELFDDGIHLDPNVVVQVWKEDYKKTLSKVLESGHSALLSSCWYLNYIKYGSDWLNFYRCVPAINNYSNSSLFLGGEACMWSEFVDETNVLPLSWPRASATAEVLWSHELNETEAKFRLEEHVCRMRRRGIPAQPASGPNYCPY